MLKISFALEKLYFYLGIQRVQVSSCLQINCEDFRPLFDEQNPGNPWAEIEVSSMLPILLSGVPPFLLFFQAKIHDMLRNLVRAVTREAPPKGLAHSPQSRAIFAVDLMLEKSEAKNGEC